MYDKKGEYYFSDNNSSILAVAHLDSVQNCTHFVKASIPKRDIVFCPTLDDRLGVYTILDLLPRCGLVYDVLLTVDEERGRSTASKFVPPVGKQYNWMFEFDRSGEDVVLYQYHYGDILKALNNVGFHIGNGIYTDICNLEMLGCQGFNVGVGYYDYHSPNAYAYMDIYLNNIKKFIQFYNKNAAVYYPHSRLYLNLNKQYAECCLCGISIVDSANIKPSKFISYDEGIYCPDCQWFLRDWREYKK